MTGFVVDSTPGKKKEKWKREGGNTHHGGFDGKNTVWFKWRKKLKKTCVRTCFYVKYGKVQATTRISFLTSCEKPFQGWMETFGEDTERLFIRWEKPFQGWMEAFGEDTERLTNPLRGTITWQSNYIELRSWLSFLVFHAVRSTTGPYQVTFQNP